MKTKISQGCFAGVLLCGLIIIVINILSLFDVNFSFPVNKITYTIFILIFIMLGFKFVMDNKKYGYLCFIFSVAMLIIGGIRWGY
jgi:hypothetical protein